MTPAEEIKYLEDVVSGKAQPTLSPPATCGRLAELYLNTPEVPGYPEKALVFVETGLRLVSADNPLYPKLRHFAAMALRWVKDPKVAVLSPHGTAAEMDRDAWQVSLDQAPREAIVFASEWGDWAWNRERWDEAGEAYANAHRALRRHIRRQVPDNTDRLDLLKYLSFATKGAYALAKTGASEQAIILLERASDLVTSANQQRWDLLRLERDHPEISARLKTSMALQQSIHERDGFDAFGNLSPAERAAQTELDAIVNEIRLISGYQSFALPSNWYYVEEASSETPLVYLVPTDKGSVTFIVKSMGDRKRDITTITADSEARQDIYSAAKAFIEAEHGDHRADPLPALDSLLEWLGTHIVISIRKALNDQGHQDKPFVIIPFGIFSQLPMHATFWRPNKPDWYQYHFHPKNVSFAYSARSLVECRHRSVKTSQGSALTINNPQPLPATVSPLVLSDFETALVTHHFHNQVLSGSDATTIKVCDALPGAEVIHFSCHGTLDRTRQYSSILLLAKSQILTYEHLLSIPDLKARLVVLSACRSGMAAITIEHVLSLPAAFIAAGAAAVLGTFWHTDELATLLLLTRFYEVWVDEGRNPAEALGLAQEWLMTTQAAQFRDKLAPQVLASPAAQALVEAPPTEPIYWRPWYWAGFFLVGA